MNRSKMVRVPQDVSFNNHSATRFVENRTRLAGAHQNGSGWQVPLEDCYAECYMKRIVECVPLLCFSGSRVVRVVFLFAIVNNKIHLAFALTIHVARQGPARAWTARILLRCKRPADCG